jgi:hypothetical protein
MCFFFTTLVGESRSEGVFGTPFSLLPIFTTGPGAVGATTDGEGSLDTGFGRNSSKTKTGDCRKDEDIGDSVSLFLFVA